MEIHGKKERKIQTRQRQREESLDIVLAGQDLRQ